ncbi:MAG: T9SS type A sorting domain-containing protein [Ignavibacteriales bacterium]|nr:T9SS type A sorting domain-containing protein [Ignavibacteriales bacterium]
MKGLLSFFFVFIFSVSVLAQLVDGYDSAPADTNYWIKYIDYAPTDTLLLDYITSPVKVGPGAMKVTYRTTGWESWGQRLVFEHWNLNPNLTYDFSGYDSISFWYYNEVPADTGFDFLLRFNLYEVSNSPSGNNTYSYSDIERYFSFLHIMTNAPGWHYVSLPLVANGNYDDKGFTLTQWGGTSYGNGTLDLDKIKGWGFELNTNVQTTKIARGKFIIDDLRLKGAHERPFVIFNGVNLNPQIAEPAVFGGATVAVAEKIGPVTNSSSLKWMMANQDGNGKNGFILNFLSNTDLNASWIPDSLNFSMKTFAGGTTFRVQFESASTTVVGTQAKLGMTFTAENDTLWHQYGLALLAFTPMDGTTGFDPSNINAFSIMTENADNSVTGKVTYLSNVWTGNPVLDVLPPVAPTNISVASDNAKYTNTITWIDVPKQLNGTYSIYYSLDPITDINAPGVEIAATGIGAGTQSFIQPLRAPVTDQNVSYYYAVVCQSQSQIIGTLAPTLSSTTTKAKGVVTISLNAPTANFAADGNLTEWTNVTPIHMAPSGGGTIVDNTVIDNDADLSLNAYLAMDNNYLYVAFDVEDDIISHSQATTWLNDAPDLYIGLYNWHGASHGGYQRGVEPDYHFRFCFDRLLDDSGIDNILVPGSEYYWGEKFPTGYVVEARIPFAILGSLFNDNVFSPTEGYRIKLDIGVGDADATGEREGILTYSPEDQDMSWADVSLWSYTWIGNLWKPVGVEKDENAVNTYSLKQNYPNPFNPATKITYTLEKTGLVTLKVYDLLGRLVTSLVNEQQNSGLHSVNFNASNLTSGIYFYQINSGKFTSTKKLMLIK